MVRFPRYASRIVMAPRIVMHEEKRRKKRKKEGKKRGKKRERKKKP